MPLSGLLPLSILYSLWSVKHDLGRSVHHLVPYPTHLSSPNLLTLLTYSIMQNCFVKSRLRDKGRQKSFFSDSFRSRRVRITQRQTVPSLLARCLSEMFSCIGVEYSKRLIRGTRLRTIAFDLLFSFYFSDIAHPSPLTLSSPLFPSTLNRTHTPECKFPKKQIAT